LIGQRFGGMVAAGGIGELNLTSDLFLVRHGQTEWNLVPRIQGHSDSPLTALGIEQARAAGRLLRSVLAGRSAAVVASPLGRARSTARIIAGEIGGAPERIAIEPRLREVSWEAWDGRSRHEIEAIQPGGWQRLQRDWSFAPEGGERYQHAADRLRHWLMSLDSHRPVIAVTHGIACCILRGLILGLGGDESLALDRPQDALFWAGRGRVERLSYTA
jgi:probable phosphoglycerate mutase